MDNDDYSGTDPEAALADFKARVQQYEKVYQPVGESEGDGAAADHSAHSTLPNPVPRSNEMKVGCGVHQDVRRGPQAGEQARQGGGGAQGAAPARVDPSRPKGHLAAAGRRDAIANRVSSQQHV